MNFISTRHSSPAVSLSDALSAGLAPDGGLYVPEHWPPPQEWSQPLPLAETAQRLLQPFFAGDVLEDHLPAICQEALDLPAPVVPSKQSNTFLLELFHGPTAAFKDFAARFLACCFARLREPETRPPLTILVATSGDTGGAVAAAFHRRPGFRVVVLYPDGKVSGRQAHQLGAFGDNVHCFKVEGCFDDCQALVKQAFADTELRAQLPLSSANSISLGRLLPQMSYYAAAASRWQTLYAEPANFVIPTGNLGNALACVWARQLGVPIGEIVLATNANRVLVDFLATGDYAPKPSLATLANAMDVGTPSNLERLRDLYPQFPRLQASVSADSVTDDVLRRVMAEAESRYGHTVCPHTAAALAAIERRRKAGDGRRYIAVATAHPAKFDSVVEPCVGHAVPVPPALEAILAQPSHAEPLAADYARFRRRLLAL